MTNLSASPIASPDKPHVLFLNEQTLRSVGGDDPQEYLRVVADCLSLHATQRTAEPPGLYWRTNIDGPLLGLAPSCLHNGAEAIGVSFSTRGRRGASPKNALNESSLVLLCSTETGKPIALLASSHLATMANAAVTAVAASLTVSPTSYRLGILGTTPLAVAHISMLHAAVSGLHDITIFDSDTGRAATLCRWVSNHLSLQTHLASNAPEAVRGQDIVIAATGTSERLIESEWLSTTRFFADAGGNEAKSDVFTWAKRIVVDDRTLCLQRRCSLKDAIESHSVGFSDICELGQIAIDRARGREYRDEPTLFCSAGMSVVHIACAACFFQRCIQQNKGLSLELSASAMFEGFEGA